MDVSKYEIISSVEQDISLVRFALSGQPIYLVNLPILSWSTLEINFIFPHIQ